jgi:predicted nucleotidyltransferase
LTSPHDESIDGWRIIDAGVEAARRQLGEGLVSAYAIGSLGHGGFSADASDVDLALLTADLSAGRLDVEAIQREVRESIPGPLAERLSVFHVAWSRFSAPPPESRFPAIDRRDLMQSGVLVFGEDGRARFGAEPPSEKVLDHSISAALVRYAPDELKAQLAGLMPESIDARTTPKLVLWPIRLLHTVDTAKAAGNDEAVAHYRDMTEPPPRHLTLVEASLGWRSGDVGDGTEALALLRADLLPLYGEVYGRLAGRSDLPHADRLAVRAAEFAAA